MQNIELRSAIEWLKYRYRYCNKKRKGEVLNELVERFSVDRKYLVRLLAPKRGGRPKTPRKGGRPGKYGDKPFQIALKKMWRITKYMCGKYLEEAMPEWLPSYEEECGAFPVDVHERLLSISGSSIDRYLKPFKAEHGLTLTRPGGVLRSEIPIQGNIWDEQHPGYLECDTSAHCGSTTMGEFVSSLTTVDIASTWTELRAVWGRGSSNVLQELKDIEASLPFPISGYDPDNGGEVLCRHIIGYFRDRKIPVTVTRSRAYKKNDQAHVEQRNSSVVRRFLGHERLDFIELTPLVNSYYREILCPLMNHFFPSHKLKDKRQEHGKRKRVYDPPMTPYARLPASPFVTDEAKEKLKAQHAALNPIKLSRQETIARKEIDQLLKKLKQERYDSVSKKEGFQIINHESFSPLHNLGDMGFEA